MDEYEQLKLKNQLCFPLYSVSNLITRNYKPLLDELDLTYTQYIAMMVLWEKKKASEKELGEALFLKSNTLTPLLKKLRAKGYVDIKRDRKDGRGIVITLTEEGEALKERAKNVPESIAKSLNLSEEEAIYLYKILYKVLEVNNNEEL
ncbi:MAG: MarR family transcriptional regulator [Bacilli bacterium]|nr:MarR family transcriptional regulator [Bacilli bacterium]